MSFAITTPSGAANQPRPHALRHESDSRRVGVEVLLQRTDRRLARLFDEQRGMWCARHPAISLGVDILERFVRVGGKQLRPSLVFLGFLGAGGELDDDLVVDLAASVEMLHAFALIHDDVMDDSDLRRHRPTVHRQFGAIHSARSWSGERRRTAEGLAVLTGDFAFALSIQLQTQLPVGVRALLDEVRNELHIGQYLDLTVAATGDRCVESIQAITRYKTATYTVERPLQLGAALAGDTSCHDTYHRFGLAIGEAFQHRDDILGVFGDPQATGKPAGDDLASAKSTLLVRHARAADPQRRCAPLRRLGTDAFSDDDATAVARFMIECGALERVEHEIRRLVADAESALEASALPLWARRRLCEVARSAAWRDR